jgi:hypothetical protein
MKLAREEIRIMVTGRNFIIKITLNLRVGTGTGTVGKKIGTRNRSRNLGKMARFRNTGLASLSFFLLLSPVVYLLSVSLSLAVSSNTVKLLSSATFLTLTKILDLKIFFFFNRSLLNKVL